MVRWQPFIHLCLGRFLTQEPKTDIEDLLANARYKRGDKMKNRDHGDYKRPSGKEKMDMARPCPQNGFSTTHTRVLPHLGSRREEEAGSTARNMEKDNGTGA